MTTAPAPEATTEQVLRDFVHGDDIAADEEVLLRLAADQEQLLQRLWRIENKLGARLEQALDDPRLAFCVTRVLRDCVRVSSAVHRRIASSLESASLLRGRRRLLHRVGVGHDD